MAEGPAMDRGEAVRAIEVGIKIVEEEFKNGLDLIGTGEMGIGNTTASSAITSVLTGASVEETTGRGAGIDDRTLTNKINIIKKAISENSPDAGDGIDVLAKVGGFEIAGLIGVILGAASKKIPILIDGFISGAAALIAYKLEPKVKDYMIASHCSVEKGHKIILDYMGLTPLLRLGLRLGEGSGAALGMNLVEAGVKILTQMATFQSASVSGEIKQK